MSDDIEITETTTTTTTTLPPVPDTPEVKAVGETYKTLKKLASRRFIITIMIIIVSSLMMYKGLIEAANYETLMIWISGIYIIGKPFGDHVARFLIAK